MRDISVSDATVDEFCGVLESAVDRPVINETNLEGEFVFEINEKHPDGGVGTGTTTLVSSHAPAPTPDFTTRMRNELGLNITPALRSVRMLVITPR